MAVDNTEVAASIETQLGSALQAPVAANGALGAAANAPDQGAEAEASSSEITVSSAILSSGAKKVTVHYSICCGLPVGKCAALSESSH